MIVITLVLAAAGVTMIMTASSNMKRMKHRKLSRFLFWTGFAMLIATAAIWMPPRGGTAFWE